MIENDNAVAVEMGKAGNFVEGGLFYPVGYIVLGLPGHEDAARVHEVLLASGLHQEECVLVSARAMVEAATKDLAAEGAIAAFGSTGQVREKQLQMAREGCEFLLVKASSDEDKALVLKALTRIPVRYAVHYRRLVIEDLIAHIPSATADSQSARMS